MDVLAGALLFQASARKSAGSFCICTGPGCAGTAARFGAVTAAPVLAHWRASASVKNSTWVSRAVPPMTTWARPWCLVDFGAGWISGASMRQAFTL
ncbi:hypothetical protein QT196_38595 (plasmid) [Streptomyces sp. P9-2B-2]|uniref:hypothetical protein n=1 Tax=Streptomyces sp. P9-2B-2 TaxID=3057114 RepID=UPI0025B557E9|nr:hypothetical protein [Streptomyces sp. P9-2B-2]WJY43180.1 hypothetical protein QT196_38595 [Streptomyces sp. P9-2B-2]